MIPTGTVTFLFTDIEGSTRLWEHHPDAMKVALARHDAILRNAIETHGGRIFKTVGDAFYATFSSAYSALSATIAFQRGLRDEPWAETGPLRVRASLNTGEPEERDGDYFGPPLNRVARLLSAGYGGQILLTSAARDAVFEELPPEVTLRDLGERRLKDLSQPEHIYQAYLPDLPADFPPLKTIDSRPNNLPAQTTLFIGRERELDAIRQRMGRQEVRVLTLIGPGGIGKSRLAIQAAADMLSAFDDGMFFVPLAALRDPALVMSSVAQTLSIRETSGKPILDALKEYLREKKLLLVLDNFEQVAPAARDVAELIAACPHLKVLATSQVPLRLRGEHQFDVPVLGLPEIGQQASAKELSRFESVRLFVERAREILWDFAVTDANAGAVAGICRRLDGLPLAIELAAARIAQFPPEEMLPRLEKRLGLLTDGAIDLPERQQTMRNAVAWSYELLEQPEQRLFDRMSIFAGGCGLRAAEEICDHDLGIPVKDGIESLATRSLVRHEEREGEQRFLMLETIREYGRERLDGSGEASLIFPRHARFFLDLAEQAEPQLTGKQQGEWMRRLEAEHDNLRVALKWSLDGQETETGAHIAAALWRFWAKRGYLTEGRGWLERTLAATPLDPSPLRATVFRGTGNVAWRQGDYAAAWRYHQESLSIHRVLADSYGVTRDLTNLGMVAVLQGDYAAARSLHEECLRISREIGDKWHVALVLNNMGVQAEDQGDYAEAKRLYEESLLIHRELGDEWAVALGLTNVAIADAYLGNYGGAEALCRESLEMHHKLGEKRNIALALHALGTVALFRGDCDGARSFAGQSLAAYREIGDKKGIAEALELLASVDSRCGEQEMAARLLGTVDVLRESIGAPIPPARREAQDRLVAMAREQLGEERFASAWEKGRQTSHEQAADQALGTTSPK